MEPTGIEPQVLAQIYEVLILWYVWALVAVVSFWMLVALLSTLVALPRAWLEQRSRSRRPVINSGQQASASSERVATDFELETDLERSAERSWSEPAAV